jgi:hypothetical protein
MLKVSLAQGFVKILQANTKKLENLKIELPNAFAEKEKGILYINFNLIFFRIYK